MKTKTAPKTPQYATYTIQDNDIVISSAPSADPERVYVQKLRDMPEEKRPREKMLKNGAKTLGAHELMAIVFNTGYKKEGVLALSERITRQYGERNILSYQDARKVAVELRLPEVKACQVVAVSELVRRFSSKNGVRTVIVKNAKDVFEYVRDMHNFPKEVLRGIYLDTHNRVIHSETISIGTVNSNLIHPREVYKPAIECGAAALILVHNHPSGKTTPSEADRRITDQMIAAGKLVGIGLLDHVIVAEGKYASVPAEYDTN